MGDRVRGRAAAQGVLLAAHACPAPSAAGPRPAAIRRALLESKEHLAGFWIMEAPDLDVALKLAAEGSKACNRRVEVRPFL
ncbi:MAG: hypothetical protein GEU93_21910 [Propionibacteriales bacterium]|nr:hypothetical protein [Propionibacteriales bacterium]